MNMGNLEIAIQKVVDEENIDLNMVSIEAIVSSVKATMIKNNFKSVV